ncbi:MAG: hypothetical protein AB7U73_08345 [Pirellulales bacterium]
MHVQDYGPVIAQLIGRERLAELGPGHLDRELAERLQTLTTDELFAHARVTDESMASACLAGLWLYADGLDQSHAISQSIETTTGSFWHGIMHRREGDFGNSKYWFRRVGKHPVFEPLAAETRRFAQQSTLSEVSGLAAQENWDPFRWIDLCETAQQPGRGNAAGTGLVDFCRRIQASEWRLLFDFSYRRAID